MTRMLVAIVLVAYAAFPRAQALNDAVRFAVIGDNGSGDQAQYDIGRQMARYRAEVPFDLVLMVGDNLYGRPSAREFVDAFEQPYKPLLDAGVRFRAVLGNHDAPDNRRSPRVCVCRRTCPALAGADGGDARGVDRRNLHAVFRDHALPGRAAARGAENRRAVDWGRRTLALAAARLLHVGRFAHRAPAREV